MSQIGTKVTASSMGAVLTLTPDSGGPIAPDGGGNINVLGGNNITTTGAGSTITIDVDGTTNHAVQIGNASGSLTSIPVGSNGQVILGSTGADPAFATLTSSDGSILFTTGPNSLSLTTAGSSADTFQTDAGVAVPVAGVLTVTGGINIATSGAGSAVTIDFDGILPVASGGTGVATLTDHGVMLGSGVGAVTVTSVGTNGQVLIGATAADPAFATLTSTGGTITFTTGANTLNLEADSGGMVWSVITGASQALVTSHGYFANNAGMITFTLPATAAVGDTFAVAGMNNATGWRVAQNAGQTIHFGAFNTTTGVGGSLTSSAIYDTIHFVCNIANLDFVVIQSIGNITVV